jgi:hypothetical protein
MLKIIFFSLIFSLSLVANAETKVEIPCYNEMFDLMEEFIESSDGTMNVVVQLINEDGANGEPQSAEVRWKAPKETFTGATVTFTMIRQNGQCIVKGL